MLRALATLAFALAALPVLGEPATARFAPAQLALAEASLERARAERALGEHAAALRFARQAELDARLAWSMTDSQFLRRDALEVQQQARALRSAPPRQHMALGQ